MMLWIESNVLACAVILGLFFVIGALKDSVEILGVTIALGFMLMIVAEYGI